MDVGRSWGPRRWLHTWLALATVFSALSGQICAAQGLLNGEAELIRMFEGEISTATPFLGGSYYFIGTHRAQVLLTSSDGMVIQTYKIRDDHRFRTVEQIALSGDGRYVLALVSANLVCVWDVTTGELLLEERLPLGPIPNQGVISSELGSTFFVLGFRGGVRKIVVAAGEAQSETLTGAQEHLSWLCDLGDGTLLRVERGQQPREPREYYVAEVSKSDTILKSEVTSFVADFSSKVDPWAPSKDQRLMCYGYEMLAIMRAKMFSESTESLAEYDASGALFDTMFMKSSSNLRFLGDSTRALAALEGGDLCLVTGSLTCRAVGVHGIIGDVQSIISGSEKSALLRTTDGTVYWCDLDPDFATNLSIQCREFSISPAKILAAQTFIDDLGRSNIIVVKNDSIDVVDLMSGQVARRVETPDSIGSVDLRLDIGLLALGYSGGGFALYSSSDLSTVRVSATCLENERAECGSVTNDYVQDIKLSSSGLYLSTVSEHWTVYGKEDDWSDPLITRKSPVPSTYYQTEFASGSDDRFLLLYEGETSPRLCLLNPPFRRRERCRRVRVDALNVISISDDLTTFLTNKRYSPSPDGVDIQRMGLLSRRTGLDGTRSVHISSSEGFVVDARILEDPSSMIVLYNEGRIEYWNLDGPSKVWELEVPKLRGVRTLAPPSEHRIVVGKTGVGWIFIGNDPTLTTQFFSNESGAYAVCSASNGCVGAEGLIDKISDSRGKGFVGDDIAELCSGSAETNVPQHLEPVRLTLATLSSDGHVLQNSFGMTTRSGHALDISARIDGSLDPPSPSVCILTDVNGVITKSPSAQVHDARLQVQVPVDAGVNRVRVGALYPGGLVSWSDWSVVQTR